MIQVPLVLALSSIPANEDPVGAYRARLCTEAMDSHATRQQSKFKTDKKSYNLGETVKISGGKAGQSLYYHKSGSPDSLKKIVLDAQGKGSFVPPTTGDWILSDMKFPKPTWKSVNVITPTP